MSPRPSAPRLEELTQPRLYPTIPRELNAVPRGLYVPHPAQLEAPSLTRQPLAEVWMMGDESYKPVDALVAGYDLDFARLYVCRAFHDGNMLPGKLRHGLNGAAYVSLDGCELHKKHYEILVGKPQLYAWVDACDDGVPPGAVEAGRTHNGETLYVGRGHYSGTLTPGRVQCSHRCLYIPYSGREERLGSYEVLVRRHEYYGAQLMAL